MSAQKKNGAPKFKVGKQVRFHWGIQDVVGVIVEDRGRSGRGGRQLYRVKSQVDPYFELDTEVPEENLTLVK